MARRAGLRLSIVPGTRERAERLFDLLTGVPISPERKERMVHAVFHDGMRTRDGQHLRLPERDED